MTDPLLVVVNFTPTSTELESGSDATLGTVLEDQIVYDVAAAAAAWVLVTEMTSEAMARLNADAMAIIRREGNLSRARSARAMHAQQATSEWPTFEPGSTVLHGAPVFSGSGACGSAGLWARGRGSGQSVGQHRRVDRKIELDRFEASITVACSHMIEVRR